MNDLARGSMWAVVLTGLGLVGWGLSALALRFDPYYCIGLCLAVLFGVVVAYKPELGILIYFTIAPFAFGVSPQVESESSDYSAGLLPAQVVLGFLLFIWLVGMMVGPKWRLVRSPLNKPLIALGAVVIASFLCSQLVYDTEVPQAHRLILSQVAEAGLFLLAIGAFFVTANSLKDEKWIKAVIYPVVGIGFYVIAFKIPDIPMVVPTPKSILVCVVVASYALAYLLFGRPRASAAVILSVLLVGCAFIAYRSLGWISGIVAMTIMLCTLILLRSKRVFVALVGLLVVAAVIGWPTLERAYQTSREQGDFDRIGIVADAANMAARTNPLLGIGPGNFYPYSFKYGTIWYGSYQYTTAHNNYAQVGAEMGVLGLAAILWVVFAGLKTGLSAFRKTRADMKWIPAAATAILAAYAVSSVFGDYMFPNRANNGLMTFGISVYIWLTLGVAVAAARFCEPSDT